jgi:hypothetical protein
MLEIAANYDIGHRYSFCWGYRGFLIAHTLVKQDDSLNHPLIFRRIVFLDFGGRILRAFTTSDNEAPETEIL